MIEDGKKFDMTKVSEMKDIGVTVDSELKFDKHINTKIETANKILGIISNNDSDFLILKLCWIVIHHWKGLENTVSEHFSLQF